MRSCVTHKPPHDLTIRDFLRIYARDWDELARLVATPGVSESWREWAESLLQKVESSTHCWLPYVSLD